MQVEVREWMSLLQPLKQLQDRELTVIHDAVLAEIPVEEQRAWLDEQRGELQDKERETLERILQLAQRTHQDHFYLDREKVPGFASLPKDQRDKLVREVLYRLSEEREGLIKSAFTTKDSKADVVEDSDTAESAAEEDPPD